MLLRAVLVGRLLRRVIGEGGPNSTSRNGRLIMFGFSFACSCMLIAQHLLYCGEYEQAIPLLMNAFLPWAAILAPPIKVMGLQFCLGSQSFAIFTQLRLLQV